jgi:Heavy-metal-associated domain
MIAMSFRVPAMTSRASVRAISARVSDVTGVRTLTTGLQTKTVRVTGSADPAQVAAAIAAAGQHSRRADRARVLAAGLPRSDPDAR